MEKLRNSFEFPIIDMNGESCTDEKGNRVQKVINVPWGVFFPADKLALINWKYETDARPETTNTPITHEGVTYNGSWAWGSLVKRGLTYGLTHDILKETCGKYDVDGQRFGRWMVNSGIYGGVTGKIKIMFRKRYSDIPGAGPVDDGFGYIRREIAEFGYNGTRKITLGNAKGSYSMWQRIPWNHEIRAEMEPKMVERLENACDPSYLIDHSHASFYEKRELCQLDKSMYEHPYIARALNRSQAEYLSRVATTPNVDAKFRVAVPTTASKVAYKPGKYVIARYPVDSNGNIQAIESETDDYTRIANMEIIQHSVSNLQMSAKGCVGIVDALDGVDMILCLDDIKMWDFETKPYDGMVIELDVAIPFTQWFAKGSAIGISSKWAKNLMGLDHDGDMVEVIDCQPYPTLWNTVSKLRPQDTPKLPKKKVALVEHDNRDFMIIRSMFNLVGFATNVMGDSLVVGDAEYLPDEVLPISRQELADHLGFKSVDSLDQKLNNGIKVGTDGFKADVDTEETWRQTGILQNKMRELNIRAPYTSWPGPYFDHHIPMVIDVAVMHHTVATHIIVEGEEIPVDKVPDETLRNAIWPHYTGTIAQICRFTLPYMRDIVGAKIAARPLKFYQNWAARPSEAEIQEAEVLIAWYQYHQRSVNWSDPTSIQLFKAIVAEHMAKQKDLSNAVWWLSHGRQGPNASATAVFVLYPEESKGIIENKPGLKKPVETIIITGLDMQIPNLNQWEGECEVMEMTLVKKGRKIIRKALVGVIPGQMQPADPYPRNLIGMIAENSYQPNNGTVKVHITRNSEKSHVGALI